MQCSKLDFEFGVAATMPPLRVHLQARRTRSVSASATGAKRFAARLSPFQGLRAFCAYTSPGAMPLNANQDHKRKNLY
jgi:hypothetical protein